MKKQILIIILVLLVLLSACTQNGPKEPSSTPNNDKTISDPISTQPIKFDNLDEAIKFIQEPDLSDYDPGEQRDYYKMVESFRLDGYITTVSHSAAKRQIDVSLYPEVKYEDIGVRYWFDLDGAWYQVLVYNTTVTLDINTDTIIDYYKIRYDITMGEYEIITPDHEILSSVVFQLVYNGTRFGAKALIDNNHYVIIRAFMDQVDKSQFIEFIEGIEFGQLPI